MKNSRFRILWIISSVISIVSGIALIVFLFTDVSKALVSATGIVVGLALMLNGVLLLTDTLARKKAMKKENGDNK